MGKETINDSGESRPDWEHLEDWLWDQVQGTIQELLEQEVAELLGRAKSARGSEPEHRTGYRNGYGKSRKVTLASGTIQVRRSRVRDRGMNYPGLVEGDGHLGIWGALRNVYPAAEQRSWNHKIMNALD